MASFALPAAKTCRGRCRLLRNPPGPEETSGGFSARHLRKWHEQCRAGEQWRHLCVSARIQQFGVHSKVPRRGLDRARLHLDADLRFLKPDNSGTRSRTSFLIQQAMPSLPTPTNRIATPGKDEATMFGFQACVWRPSGNAPAIDCKNMHWELR